MLKEVDSVKEKINKQLKPALLKDSVSYKKEGSLPEKCITMWVLKELCFLHNFFIFTIFSLKSVVKIYKVNYYII